jgi:hypothetical protein
VTISDGGTAALLLDELLVQMLLNGRYMLCSDT